MQNELQFAKRLAMEIRHVMKNNHLTHLAHFLLIAM